MERGREMMETTESLSQPMRYIGRIASPSWAEPDFERVFTENYARVVGVLFRLVGDHTRAEELANEVFWKLYRHPLAPDVNLRAWLYRTATNLGIDVIRASTRRRH